MPTIPAIQPRKRVAAYARVSIEKETMIESLAAQVGYYRTHIQRNPEWQYVGVYADEGITGTKSARPEFQRLIADCNAGLIDMVITKSLSRFSRNTLDTLNILRELKERDVDVFFERENIHSISGDGELMLTILSSYAQEESRSASENVKWRLRKKYEQGEITGWCQLYGYRISHGNVEIDNFKAAIVRRIFSEYLAGESATAIAKRLRIEGVPCEQGGQWKQFVVSEILRNEKYTGCQLLQKTFTKDHLAKRAQKNQGELPMYFAEGSHPAIIDRETYEQAQQILAENRRKSNAQRSHTARYAFSGMIECGCCGKHYRRKTLNGKIWWQCTTYLAKGKQYCQAKQIPDDTLYELTCEVLGLSSFDEEAFRAKIQSIHIPFDNHVVFQLVDGRVIETIWTDRPRSKSRTGDKFQGTTNRMEGKSL